MCATLVGGMDRLKTDYTKTAKRQGVKLKVFTGKERNMRGQIGSPDLIIIFTGKCSHKARILALKHASSCNIPVAQSHSCGISSLKGCLENIGESG